MADRLLRMRHFKNCLPKDVEVLRHQIRLAKMRTWYERNRLLNARGLDCFSLFFCRDFRALSC